MLSLAQMLLLLVAASVGLSNFANCAAAGLENLGDNEQARALFLNPTKLSDLGDLKVEKWVKILNDMYRPESPDEAFEVLKKLDKIYESLGGGDDGGGASTQIKYEDSRQKIVELVEEANRSSVDNQFCTRANLDELERLIKYYWSCLPNGETSPNVYFQKRKRDFVSLCRLYALIVYLFSTNEHDIVLLGNELVILQSQGVNPVNQRYYRFSTEWMDILLAFLKARSGNNLSPKVYIAAPEGKAKFLKLWEESVVDMCRRYIDAMEAARMQDSDYARLIDYSKVCKELILRDTMIAETLYSEFRSKLSKISKLKMTLNSGFKKLATCSGCKD